MPSRNFLAVSAIVCLPLMFAVASMDARAQIATPTGKIVFARSTSNADGSIRSSSLFSMDADGTDVRQLTPTLAGIQQASPSWAPLGGRIVFTQYDAAADQYDLRVMDSQGSRNRQITLGTQDFTMPVWGHGETIAFIYDRPGSSCLGTVLADGSQQKLDLFCTLMEGSRVSRIHKLTWSADGNYIYLDAAFPHVTSETWTEWAYKVDARTGAAIELFRSDDFYSAPEVEFSPDGRNALFAGVFDFGDFDPSQAAAYTGISRVDFLSRQPTLLINDRTARAPLYSKDGCKFAYTLTRLSGDLRYDPLFVANADGTHVRRLTALSDNVEYKAVEWSKDGTQLLVNRTTYTEDGGQRRISRRSLRIIDVNTREVRALPGGYAYRGAWFQKK